MPFAYILDQLQDGQAAKRPTWGGYVKREDGQNGAYTLTFKNRAGTSYAFAWSGSAWSTTASLTLDAELLAAMAAQDWIIGDAAEFETARAGTGTW